MTVYVRLDLQQALTGKGLRVRMEEIAKVVQEQVQERIRQGGDEEVLFKQLDFDRPSGGHDNPLYDTGKHLHDSIIHGVDSNGPWVGSTFIGSLVHQFGTVGKGGKLQPISAKPGSALFIPLTKRAAKAVTTGKVGKYIKRTKGQIEAAGLAKGEDFILVDQINIHPRPFLRLSKRNLAEIALIMGDGGK